MASLQRAEECLAAAKRLNSELNAFISLIKQPIARPPFITARKPNSDGMTSEKRRLLHGLPLAVKDNIATTGLPTTCASGILRNYISPFNATIIDRLQEEGAVVVGKTNMDEFAMGSHTIHSHFGPVRQPAFESKTVSAGGSSGGSAVAVATEQCQIALGTDTGGSVRLPAAYCGIVGFKPSYGLISRYGVIPYANSLDTVGILGKSVQDIGDVFKVINSSDERDPTCLSEGTRSRMEVQRSKHAYWGRRSGLRIGIPLEYNILELSPLVRQLWKQTAKMLRDMGHTILPVSLPNTRNAPSSYFILAPAEATSNLAKYDGVEYGSRLPEKGPVLYTATRSGGFGAEVRRRILVGSYSLSSSAADNYFLQAQRIRQLVRKDFDEVFTLPNPLRSLSTTTDVDENGRVDFLLTPTTPSPPPLLDEAQSQDPLVENTSDIFTIPSNLAGIPAISLPVAVNEQEARDAGCHVRSLGMQMIGQYGTDEWLLDVAKDTLHQLEGTKRLD